VSSILRASCWVDLHSQAQLEIVIRDTAREPDWNAITMRATFTDRNQLLELAEKLRLVGAAMPINKEAP